jgi:hypothetical protein
MKSASGGSLVALWCGPRARQLFWQHTSATTDKIRYVPSHFDSTGATSSPRPPPAPLVQAEDRACPEAAEVIALIKIKGWSQMTWPDDGKMPRRCRSLGRVDRCRWPPSGKYSMWA